MSDHSYVSIDEIYKKIVSTAAVAPMMQKNRLYGLCGPVALFHIILCVVACFLHIK